LPFNKYVNLFYTVVEKFDRNKTDSFSQVTAHFIFRATIGQCPMRLTAVLIPGP